MKLLGIGDEVLILEGDFSKEQGKVVTFNKERNILVDLGKRGKHNFKFEQLRKV